MFWRRKNVGPVLQRCAAEVREDSRVDVNGAIEGAAEILRARARHAFQIGDEDAANMASSFEGWASHLLVNAPPPGAVGWTPGGPPDWRGLTSFVESHAKAEQVWVEAVLRDMREAVFALVASLGRASNAHGRQDELLRRRLSSLNNAVESGSLDALKREALAVAATVTQVLEEQRSLEQRNAEELKARVHMLGEQLEQTRREGETDPLTKLANRRVFDASLARSLTVAGVVERPLTLMMVDIDHFKRINDKYGHPAGDKVLSAVANALARAFPRRSDLVARYGGEEFGVVLADSGHAEMRMLAERLLTSIRALRVDVRGTTVSVTVSIGAAVALAGEEVASLLARADGALYAAKNTGRDRFVAARVPALRSSWPDPPASEGVSAQT